MNATVLLVLFMLVFLFSILAQLKHPNIVAYHDSYFDDTEEFLYIIQVFRKAKNMFYLFVLYLVSFKQRA